MNQNMERRAQWEFEEVDLDEWIKEFQRAQSSRSPAEAEEPEEAPARGGRQGEDLKERVDALAAEVQEVRSNLNEQLLTLTEDLRGLAKRLGATQEEQSAGRGRTAASRRKARGGARAKRRRK